jgi:uncharacterized membrane protein
VHGSNGPASGSAHPCEVGLVEPIFTGAFLPRHLHCSTPAMSRRSLVTRAPGSDADASADSEAHSLERRLFCSLKVRADAQRTAMQRMADWMTNAAGSTVFLIGNAAWFLIWTVWNTRLIPGLAPFDAFPFGLLTTILSIEAILLSIFVLMAQNRSARIDQLRQEFDLQINLIAESELTKVLCLVSKIAEKQGIDVAGDEDLQEMLAPTNVEKIERVLERQIEHPQRSRVRGDAQRVGPDASRSERSRTDDRGVRREVEG